MIRPARIHFSKGQLAVRLARIHDIDSPGVFTTRSMWTQRAQSSWRGAKGVTMRQRDAVCLQIRFFFAPNLIIGVKHIHAVCHFEIAAGLPPGRAPISPDAGR